MEESSHIALSSLLSMERGGGCDTELHLSFRWGEVKIERTHTQPCVIRKISVTWNVYPVLPFI